MVGALVELRRRAYDAGNARFDAVRDGDGDGGVFPVRRRIRLRRFVGGGVHVPDAGVPFAPDSGRGGRGGRRRVAVVREDLRFRRKSRHLDPDEGLAVGGPRVDLVRQEVAVRVGETQIPAAGKLELGVIEPVRGAHAHESGKVFERSRSRVSVERDFDLLGEARPIGNVGAKRLRRGERSRRRGGGRHGDGQCVELFFHGSFCTSVAARRH